MSLGWLTLLRLRMQRAFWARAQDRLPQTDVRDAQSLRAEAKRLRRTLDTVIAAVENKVDQPRQIAEAMRHAPPMTDWAWRPSLWRKTCALAGFAGQPAPWHFDTEVSLHHDCPLSLISARQIRPAGDTGYGLAIDLLGFAGSYLSLVVQMPDAALADLGKRHIISVEVNHRSEVPAKLFARLNIVFGPNTETIVREFHAKEYRQIAEFDLAYAGLNGQGIERAWLDILVERPAANRLLFYDLLFYRRPRAEI